MFLTLGLKEGRRIQMRRKGDFWGDGRWGGPRAVGKCGLARGPPHLERPSAAEQG